MHESDHVVLTDGILSDNVVSIEFDADNYCHVADTLIVGQTANFGHPTGCDVSSLQNCQPVNCSLPLAQSSPADGSARSLPQPGNGNPIVGVSFGQVGSWNILLCFPDHFVYFISFVNMLYKMKVDASTTIFCWAGGHS